MRMCYWLARVNWVRLKERSWAAWAITVYIIVHVPSLRLKHTLHILKESMNTATYSTENLNNSIFITYNYTKTTIILYKLHILTYRSTSFVYVICQILRHISFLWYIDLSYKELTSFHDKHVEIHPIPSDISICHYCSFRDKLLMGCNRKILLISRDSFGNVVVRKLEKCANSRYPGIL